MSMNRDFQRTDDEIVSLLSQWLMGSVGNDELRKRIEEIGTDELAPGQRAAVGELLVALGNAFPGERGDLERVIRETMEELAYGEEMFTGIVREVGRVLSFDGSRLVVGAEAPRAAEGDSVAVDGVCLTAVDGSQLAFDVVDETLSRTTLRSPRPGSPRHPEPR